MRAVALAIAAALALCAARAEARGCHEISDWVGYHRCTVFGADWSREADTPNLWIELGYFRHDFISAPFSLATTDASQSAPEHYDLHTTGGGIAWRTLGGIGRVFYTGLELEPGWIAHAPTVPGPTPTDDEYLAASLIAGVHGELLRIGLSAELAAGGRYEDFDYCPEKGCKDVDADQTSWMLEARVRADLFVVPHFSIGVMYGKSLIDRDDHSVMFYIGLHGRAVDGMY
ncbi:MAG TPA: hypothetical protein VLX92_26170 [Kofleriaceae bacterium]|nr:hypothetical protein [Kofleriaceae bacterium]